MIYYKIILLILSPSFAFGGMKIEQYVHLINSSGGKMVFTPKDQK